LLFHVEKFSFGRFGLTWSYAAEIKQKPKVVVVVLVTYVVCELSHGRRSD